MLPGNPCQVCGRSGTDAGVVRTHRGNEKHIGMTCCGLRESSHVYYAQVHKGIGHLLGEVDLERV